MARQVVVVLGMHKSGTTLVAKMLHRSGIEMDQTAGADGDYDRGDFYERPECKRLNVEILGSGMPAYRHPTPRNLQLRDDQRSRMRAIVTRLEARGRSWGFKDPRTCLTYDLWEPELPRHKLLLVYRSPAEVWGHLSRHGTRAYHVHHAWHALRSWCDHSLPLVRLAESSPHDALIVSFEKLMTEDLELERIQSFLGVPLTDVREARRYRIRTDGGLRFAATARLRRLLGRDDAAALHERLEALRAEQVAGRLAVERTAA